MFLEKAEEPKIKLPTFAGSSEKQESYRKLYFYFSIYFCFIDYDKDFDCVDHNYKRPPDLPLEKRVCRSGKQQLELDMEQQTGSK